MSVRRTSIFRNRSASQPAADEFESSQTSTDGIRLQEMEQQLPTRGRFMRRSSLDNAGTSRRTTSFFQRRSSLGGGNNSSAQPQQQQAAQQQQQQQQPVGPVRRMFRRASTGQAPSSFAESTTSQQSPQASRMPDRIVTGGNARQQRRGSFGFSGGDSAPPRPVVRRGSMGQDRSSAGIPSDSVTSGGLPERTNVRHDPYRDSVKLITSEAPRRVSRRSSLGPGITTSSFVSNASNHSVASINSVNSEDVARSPGRMKRLKKAFSNTLFRRGKKKTIQQEKPIQEDDPSMMDLNPASWGYGYGDDAEQQYLTGVTTNPATPEQMEGDDPALSWKPAEEDIMEDEELYPPSPMPSPHDGVRRVHFASEPEFHDMDYGGEPDGQGESVTFEELKAELWWNSEEMAQIRQECMEVVKDYLDDTEYMEAVTKLFMAYKKSVTEEEVESALEKVSKRRLVRGLEMHIVPRGGLLCEKHRRIVLTNVASATVDGLSGTGEGWYLIRKESMKASRPCRQYAQKMAEHDAMEAIEATISSWAEEDEDVAAFERKRAKEKAQREIEEEEADIATSNKTRTTPFIPSSNDVAPMAPKKHVSEVDEEEVNNQSKSEESAKEQEAETTPQQAGEGSSQDC